MALTPNFRLQDTGTPDAWRNLDSILMTVAQHIHNGSNVSTVSPVDGPDLTSDDSGGSIPGGSTFYYTITLVDASGRESAPSAVVSVSTPDPIDTPDAPSVQYTPTGGFMASGAYLYALSAYVNGDTYLETQESPSVQVVIPAGTVTNKVRVTFPDLPDGADGWNVYRLKPNGLTLAYMNSIDMTGGTPPTYWDDTGVIADDCNRRPAPSNATGSSGSILVEYPDATVPVGYTWRVYRSITPGDWQDTLAHSVIEETSEGSGIITTEWLDDGDGTLPQSPPPLGASNVPMPQKVNIDTETVGQLPAARIDGLGATEWITELFDLTAETPGTLPLDLTSLDESVSIVLVSLPSGADSMLDVDLPDPTGRGPLTILAAWLGGSTDTVSIDAGSSLGPLRTSPGVGKASLQLLPLSDGVVEGWFNPPALPDNPYADNDTALRAILTQSNDEYPTWEVSGEWEDLIDSGSTLPNWRGLAPDDTTPAALRIRRVPGGRAQLEGQAVYMDTDGTTPITPSASSVIAVLPSWALPLDSPVLVGHGTDQSGPTIGNVGVVIDKVTGEIIVQIPYGQIYGFNAEWDIAVS